MPPPRPANLALALAIAAGVLSCERDASRLLRDAEAAAAATPPNYSLAQKYLEEILERTAEDTSPVAATARKQAHLLLGLNYRSMGVWNAAETQLKAALTIDPSDTGVLGILALTLTDRGGRLPDADGKNDLDYAIDYASRALRAATDDWAATSASGRARLARGRLRRQTVTTDILTNASGSDLDALRERIAVACALPSDEPRSIALVRELERRLELRGTDVRARIAEGIAGAREDLLLAFRYLRQSLTAQPAEFTGATYMMLIGALRECGQLEEAVLLSRLALHVPFYRKEGVIVDDISEVFFEAKLYRPSAEVVDDFLEGTTTYIPNGARRRALSAADRAGDPALLERTLAAVRKKLGRDPDSLVVGRLCEYYDAVLAEKRGGNPKDVLRSLGEIASKLDPNLAEVIPAAAATAAKYARQIVGDAAAKEYVDIGLGTDPKNVPLLLLRAQLNLDGKGDPYRAGQDLRRVIVERPRQVESFLPMLQNAAAHYVAKTGRSLATIEDEASGQSKRIPSGFEDGWIYYVFARDYYSQGKWREAANCALEALAHDADFAVANVLLGLARARLGEAVEARQAFDRADGIFPNDPSMARAIAETGLAPATIALHLIATRPEVEGRIVVAASMLERGQRAAAARILTPVLGLAELPDEAKLLAARLLVSDSVASSPSDLASRPSDAKLLALTEQVRLESALRRGDAAAAAASVEALERDKVRAEPSRLLPAVEDAVLAGNAGAAVQAARWFADTAATADLERALSTYAHTLLCAGEAAAAVRALDRWAGLQTGPDACIWLGLALHRAGDRTGVAEALAMLREDWALAPVLYQRAVLAVLAGLDPTPEEVLAVPVTIEDPLSVLAAGAMFVAKVGRPPSEKELPPLSPWVAAAAEFVGSSKERAESVLRLALALRTPGGGLDALTELAQIDGAGASSFSKVLRADALASIPRLREQALPLYAEAASAMPDMDHAWRRAHDLARDLGRDEQTCVIAKAWAAARPGSEEARIAARHAEARRRLAQREDLAGLEKDLADFGRQRPNDFESALLLLETRIALDRRLDAVAGVKDLVRLCEADPLRTKRAIAPAMLALKLGLPASESDARDAARRLGALAPEDWRPVELSVICDLLVERYAEAAEAALRFLKQAGRLQKLKAEEIARFVELLSKSNPAEAADLAELAVGVEPGELERWQTFATAFENLGRDEEAIRVLDPFVQIEPTHALRSRLTEMLAKPGNDPGRALALLEGAPSSAPGSGPASRPAGGDERPLLERVALSRAHALLGDGPRAVEALEPWLVSRVGEPVTAETAPAWRTLAFAYATRCEANDLTQAAMIANRLAESLGPEAAERARSIAGVFLGFQRNVWAAAARSAEAGAATRPASAPAPGPASAPSVPPGREAASAPASAPGR